VQAYLKATGKSVVEATFVPAAEIIDKHMNAAPPPLPRAHDEFQPLIDALLAKDPDQRPQSAEAALRLIEELFYG